MKSIQTKLMILGICTVAAALPINVFASEVLSLSNQPSGNTLQLFSVQGDGSLTPTMSVPTGGIGTGSGLGSQGAVAYDERTGLIAAVNAGDNSISIFTKRGNNIRLSSRVSSRGYRPVSVTMRNNILFVLNQGDANHPSNIQGFRTFLGSAYPINGGASGLSATFTNPAQVSFAPNGRSLVVTEKATNKIGVFDVNQQGYIWGSHFTSSAGQTPFGFAFDSRGYLFVTEAFGGASNASTVSSYVKTNSGALSAISAAVPTTQTAACWAAVSPDDRFVFAANAGSGTISTFEIGRHGIIDLVGNSTPIPGSTPVDMALSKNGRNVYLLGAGIPGIVTFHVGNNGLLTQIDTDAVVHGSAGITFIN